MYIKEDEWNVEKGIISKFANFPRGVWGKKYFSLFHLITNSLSSPISLSHCKRGRYIFIADSDCFVTIIFDVINEKNPHLPSVH